MWGRRVAATAVLLPFMARTAAQQVLFVAEQNSFSPITPELKQFADELLKNATIPGLSLAVVHLNGSFDSASFGVRIEEGDGMTTDVSFYELISFTLFLVIKYEHSHATNYRRCSVSRRARKRFSRALSVFLLTTLHKDGMSLHYQKA